MKAKLTIIGTFPTWLLSCLLLACWTEPSTTSEPATFSALSVQDSSSRTASIGPSPDDREENPLGKRLVDYMEVARKNGPQRMIVRFGLAVTSEPLLENQEAVEAQRARIRSVQMGFLAQIERDQDGSEWLFQTVPYLAIDLGAEDFERLMSLISADGRSLLLTVGGEQVAFDLESNIRLEGMTVDLACLPIVMKTMLANTQAAQLHLKGHQGEDQTIVVIDDGVDQRHPHLADRTLKKKVINGSFFAHKSASSCPAPPCIGLAFGNPLAPKTYTEFSHGTKVAILSAGWAPDIDQPDLIAGVAPMAHLISIRVEDEFGGKYTEDVAKALEQVIVNWSKVAQVAAVCISLASKTTYVDVCDPDLSAPPDPLDPEDTNIRLIFGFVASLKLMDIAVVVAAGNQNADALAFPACLSNVVAVAASSSDAPLEGSLNWSPHVDLVAPAIGVGIPNIFIRGAHGFSGTSAAAPQVAGAIALLRAATDCSLDAILAALKASPLSASKTGVSLTLPVIQIEDALTKLQSEPCGTPPPEEREPVIPVNAAASQQ